MTTGSAKKYKWDLQEDGLNRRRSRAGTSESLPQRLAESEFLSFLKNCPAETVDLVLELRAVILTEAPKVIEAIRFGGLCYFKGGKPYGSIGGNVCGISTKNDVVALNFIHGAFLPDRGKLLTGSGKSLRRVVIQSKAACRDAAVRKLIRDAFAYCPPGIQDY